jgi:hypothetical protein
VRQLLSSVFDAVTAVGTVVLVPAAALNRTAPVIAAALVFLVLLTARIAIERSKVRAS